MAGHVPVKQIWPFRYRAGKIICAFYPSCQQMARFTTNFCTFTEKFYSDFEGFESVGAANSPVTLVASAAMLSV